MKSEVLIAMNIKIMVFWDVTLEYLHCRGTCYLHPQEGDGK
jgi:hypothetical protein